MTEPDSSDRQRDDPAEALANMAEGRDDQTAASPEGANPAPDATEALDQMAGEQADDAAELEDLVEVEDESVTPEMAAAAGFTGRQARSARRARAAAQQARAHAETYKKTMIPLLLVMGGLLIVVGLLGVSMLTAAEAAEKQTRWHLWMTGVALVSFPLGAILFFGAWWFHREVRR